MSGQHQILTAALDLLRDDRLVCDNHIKRLTLERVQRIVRLSHQQVIIADHADTVIGQQPALIVQDLEPARLHHILVNARRASAVVMVSPDSKLARLCLDLGKSSRKAG